MKAHIGADTKSGLVHTVVGTAANVADVAQAHALLHGEEKQAHVDAGYAGADKREEIAAAHPNVQWHIADKRGKIKAMVEGPLKQLAQQAERLKASIRARVEHPFHILKNLFHSRKTRYRGLAKNMAQLHTLFALVNLVIAKRSLLAEVHAP